VSIGHQTAMPEVASRSRHRALLHAPEPQHGRTLAKISGLIALTALGGAFAAGGVGLALILALATARG
jgi:hypothetical protein